MPVSEIIDGVTFSNLTVDELRAEVLKMQIKYARLVELAARVVRHHDRGTLAKQKDSDCIERLRLEITGS